MLVQNLSYVLAHNFYVLFHKTSDLAFKGWKEYTAYIAFLLYNYADCMKRYTNNIIYTIGKVWLDT